MNENLQTGVSVSENEANALAIIGGDAVVKNVEGMNMIAGSVNHSVTWNRA